MSEGADLFYVIIGEGGDGLVQQHARLRRIVGERNVSDRFLGESGADDSILGSPDPKTQPHALPAALVEALGAGEQDRSGSSTDDVRCSITAFRDRPPGHAQLVGRVRHGGAFSAYGR